MNKIKVTGVGKLHKQFCHGHFRYGNVTTVTEVYTLYNPLFVCVFAELLGGDPAGEQRRVQPRPLQGPGRQGGRRQLRQRLQGSVIRE